MFVLVLPKDWTACLGPARAGIVALLPADCQNGKTKENGWEAVAGKEERKFTNFRSEGEEKENEVGDPA